MNYTAFEQMQTSPLVRQKEEPAQDYMERIFRVACGPAEDGQDRPVRVNDMLEPEFVSCSAVEQTLELGFPLNEWMLNPMGTMHGGIIATAVDLTMGSLTRFYRHTGTISTVTLGLSYMRPVRARGSVTVQACMEKLGRSVAFLNARVFDADGHLCVTATASFM